MSHVNERTITNLIGKQRSGRRSRALIVIMLVLGTLVCRPQAYAVDGTDTFFGVQAGESTTSGTNDSAFGASALRFNTTGSFNTAAGTQALYFNTTGSFNTASGIYALYNNVDGGYNTATGVFALTDNSSGGYNTASGAQALESNTTGGQNTADGATALYTNTTGYSNTASGFSALFNNTIGHHNTADGAAALYVNTTGSLNTAFGNSALGNNSTGSYNSADGFQALLNNTNGTNNTAAGANALFNNTTGKNNVALGSSAGSNLTTGSNNIVIGANVLGKAGDANKIQIGKQGTQSATYIAGISGKTVASASAVAVFVDSTGKLGTVKSSARYKDHIKPMNKSSEAILKLEPVTFRYKEELDSDGVTQFGLIAEQVEKVDPGLVVRDEEGKVSTVRYEAVNAMLLNEFLKNHHIDQDQAQELQEQAALIQRLTTIIARQEAAYTKQAKKIEALTAQLQKVSNRLELRRATLLANDQ